MRTLIALGIAGLLATGCGGSVAFTSGGSGGTGGTGGTGGSGGSAGTGGSGGGSGITGSHDLTLSNVQASPDSSGQTSPSEGAALRIDIRKTPGGYLAAATPRWGDPTPLSIDVTGKQVTLTGDVEIWSTSPTVDRWTKLVLPRDAQGRLIGSISATGKETISMGDVIEMADLTGGGTIGPDVTAPQYQSTPASQHGPPGMLLPWDPITVRVAEGVDQSALRAHVSIEPALAAGSGSGTSSGPSGGPFQPPVDWQLSPAAQDKLGWVGATTATARIGDWSMDGAAFALLVQAGVKDRAGHAAKAFNAMFNWVPLGQPQPAYDFTSPGAASWGNVVFQQACPPGAMCTTQLTCQSDACAVFEPFDNGVCGAPRSGFAGRLDPGAHLVVHYRVLVGADYPDPTGPPVPGTSFSVEVATPGKDATDHGVIVAASDLSSLPVPIGNLQWGTPEKTLTIPANSTAENGFAIYAGLGPGNCSPDGGMLPPPVPTAVIIDSVQTL